MSTDHHTPIPEGAPGNSATVNAPLAQLDNAIKRLDWIPDQPASPTGQEFVRDDGGFAVPEGTGDTNGHVVQSEGVDQPQRVRMDFKGLGVEVENGVNGTEVVFSSRKPINLNGDFQVWQLGTSISNPTTGKYLADMWKTTFNGSGATRVISQQAFTPGQTDVPGNPPYFMRWVESVAGSGETYKQLNLVIEDVTKYAGKTITLPVFAKADSAIATRAIQYFQKFGSGGSSDVGGVISTGINLTTDWQEFTFTFDLPSISGKTLGIRHYLEIQIGLPLNTAFTIDIARVLPVEGSNVNLEKILPEEIGETLRKCLRHKWVIATDVGIYVTESMLSQDINECFCVIQMPVPMSGNPTFSYEGVLNTDLVLRDYATAGKTMTSLVLAQYDEMFFRLRAITSGALIANNIYKLRLTTNGKLIFSSEF